MYLVQGLFLLFGESFWHGLLLEDLLTYIYTGDDPTLDFTVDDGVQLLDGQSVVSPGSLIVPNHEYTLRRTHGSNTQVTADSRIIFSKE